MSSRTTDVEADCEADMRRMNGIHRAYEELGRNHGSLVQEIFGKLDPLEIVVLGEEGVGKSTLLSMLVGWNFLPQGFDICTRMAIRVVIRNRPNRAQTACVSVVDSATGDIVPDSRRDLPVREAADVIAETMQAHVDEDVGVSLDRELRVEIFSPNLPHMNLLDLPGITQDKVLRQKTRDLARRHIDRCKDKGVFLAVVDATKSTRCSPAIELIQEYELENFAIGVLTKSDRVEKNRLHHDLVVKLSANSDNKPESHVLLGHGYVATMFKSLGSEKNGNVVQRLVTAEQDFFRGMTGRLGGTDLVARNQASLNALTSRIIQMCHDFMVLKFVPQTVETILATMRDTQMQSISLGMPAPGDPALRTEALKLLKNLVRPCLEQYRADFIAWQQQLFQEVTDILVDTVVPQHKATSTLREKCESVLAALDKAAAELPKAWIQKLKDVFTDSGPFKLWRFPETVAIVLKYWEAHAPRVCTSLAKKYACEYICNNPVSVSVAHDFTLGENGNTPTVAIKFASEIVNGMLLKLADGHKWPHGWVNLCDANKLESWAQHDDAVWSTLSEEVETCAASRLEHNLFLDECIRAIRDMLNVVCDISVADNILPLKDFLEKALPKWEMDSDTKSILENMPPVRFPIRQGFKLRLVLQDLR